MWRLVLAILLLSACRSRAETSPTNEVAVRMEPAASTVAPRLPPVVTSDEPSEPALGSRIELARGLSVEGWSVSPSVQSHVVRIDLSTWELVAWLGDQLGPEREPPAAAAARAPVRYRLPAFAAAAGARVAINGGFFDEVGSPMGLRVSERRLLRPALKRDWGVFFVKDGRPGQVHSRDVALASGAEFAIQCGPRLVHEGVPFRLRPGSHRRTVIGSTASGEVLLVATLAPIQLGDLATALAREVNAGGLGIHHALNLDGGPSTQMVLPGQDPRWSVGGLAPVSDAVVVLPRASPQSEEERD